MRIVPTERDEARFWSKVLLPDGNGCMLWTANKGHNGYGLLQVGAHTVRAHRLSYELANGPIPRGMVIDHLCRVRHCVAPLHLEAVTQGENSRRGLTGKVNRASARKTHCPQGHPYAGKNLYTYPSGARGCRACGRVRDLARPRRKGGLR